ncbi:MAG: hypothetical protein WAO19_01590 [Candidatus Kryptoniota bacterium]
MIFSQVDRYVRYMMGATILIALLTYWRFRGIELSSVYGYVAQQDVVHSQMFGNISEARPVVWDFFGLINKLLMPHSIIIIKIFGLALIVLNLVLIPKLLDYMLGQRFWGFLCVFLTALSPFSVIAAVSGGPWAIAVVITVIFLTAIYRNEYVFAGILSGVAMAANLPGVIMFLITILDLLQNSTDRKKITSRILLSTAGFFGVAAVLFAYSAYSGSVRIFSVPISESNLIWNFVAVVPLCVVNMLNIAGIVYLIVRKRYDFYKTHFHTLMLWITSSALCMVQPSTLNYSVAMVISTILSMFFLQGFASLWDLKLVPPETFVFVFVVVFLFSDLYANNKFLKDVVLAESAERTGVVNEVAAAIMSTGRNYQLVSNFSPEELSVKLGKKVFAVQENILPMSGWIPVVDEGFVSGKTSRENISVPGSKMIYVAQRTSRVDTLFSGCESLLSTNYSEGGKVHFVKVTRCENNNE